MLFRTAQLFYTIFIFTLNYVTNNMFYVTGGRSLDITSENFQIFRLAEALYVETEIVTSILVNLSG